MIFKRDLCIDDSQDTFRKLGGIDLLIKCLTKHKELSNEAVACFAKVMDGNSKKLISLKVISLLLIYFVCFFRRELEDII